MADNRHAGRIVKITSWCDERSGRLTHALVWAVVTPWMRPLDPGELNVTLLIYPDEVKEQITDYGFKDWTLAPEDAWTFVKPRDVPDEVWAALAKWRLSQ